MAVKKQALKPAVPEVKKEEIKPTEEIIKRGRYYDLIRPAKANFQGELFDIPLDPVGVATKEFTLLFCAKKEVMENLKKAEQTLVAALRTANRPRISFQVGATTLTLAIKNIDSKQVIAIEKL